MLNFTVGPVQSSPEVRNIGSEQIPYFRTKEFSKVMFENEKLIKKFSHSGKDSKVLFITGSGSASMEASVINSFTAEDKLLIINGGTFGQRFVDICKIYDLNFDEIVLEPGFGITTKDLEKYDSKGYTGLLVNYDETSTGVLYDMKVISEFSKKNNLFLVVDAISAFLCDDFHMEEYGVDIMITGSQKVIACPPGISIMILSKVAVDRVNNNKVKSFYFDLKRYINSMDSGQTPFTPAIGILLQINKRLKEIETNGGEKVEINRVNALAVDFRKKIKGLPFETFSNSKANAVTALKPLNVKARDLFNTLKEEYGIWVCPSGAKKAPDLVRIGHIGYLTEKDNDILINAFKELEKQGKL